MADHFDISMNFGIGQPVRRYEDVRLLTGADIINQPISILFAPFRGSLRSLRFPVLASNDRGPRGFGA